MQIKRCPLVPLVLGATLAGGAGCHHQVLVSEATAVLTPTDAPAVPSPVYDRKPRLDIVELEVQEKVMNLADGVKHTFWTFGGHVPGRFIRVAQGDSVELHLKNDAGSRPRGPSTAPPRSPSSIARAPYGDAPRLHPRRARSWRAWPSANPPRRDEGVIWS